MQTLYLFLGFFKATIKYIIEIITRDTPIKIAQLAKNSNGKIFIISSSLGLKSQSLLPGKAI